MISNIARTGKWQAEVYGVDVCVCVALDVVHMNTHTANASCLGNEGLDKQLTECRPFNIVTGPMFSNSSCKSGSAWA